MEYVRDSLTLLANRAEVFEEDLLEILQNGDFSTWEAFKNYWNSRNFSMFHQSIQEKEDKTEFYHSLYSVLTSKN